jgi:drug/metabolite transporter (DMT)-like permease
MSHAGDHAPTDVPLLPKGNVTANAPPTNTRLSWLYAALFLSSYLFYIVLNKHASNHIKNYPFFLNLFCASTLCVLFGLISAALRWTGRLSTAELQFPRRRFCVMGSLEGLGYMLIAFGQVYTAGNLQPLLGQTCVPVSMLFGMMVFRRVPPRWHVIGACIILGGVFCILAPQFSNSDSSDATDNRLLFNIIFACASIPLAMSAVYKQVAFAEISLNPFFLQFWVNLFNVVAQFVLLPLNCLSVFGPAHVAFADLGTVLSNGAACLLWGRNTITTNCGVGIFQSRYSDSGHGCCDCHHCCVNCSVLFAMS